MRLFRRGRRSTDVSELNEAEKGMRALILNIPLFITSVWLIFLPFLSIHETKLHVFTLFWKYFFLLNLFLILKALGLPLLVVCHFTNQISHLSKQVHLHSL